MRKQASEIGAELPQKSAPVSEPASEPRVEPLALWVTAVYLSSTYMGPPFYRASLVAQRVKNPPTMWETQLQSLGREDLLEKRMATHSSILAWRISWTEEPGGLGSVGSQRARHN